MHTPDPRRWRGLAVLAVAQFMVIMDTSIIGVALPQIQQDLGFTQANLSWVFNAYVIALGGLLLLGGKLSDLLGARAVFMTGFAILAAGSLGAGLAGSVGVEIGARAVQGAGAALIAPSGLALLFTLFGGNPRELGKAMALYGAAAPAGGTAGVFLGGVLTEWLSWPWVFYVNVPIAVAVLLVSRGLLPKAARVKGKLDLTGAAVITSALSLGVFGIVRAPEVGWSSNEVAGSVALAVMLSVAFVWLQRVRREPLVPLSIFRAPNLASGNAAMTLLGAAWIPMWFFLNLYLQQSLGYGPFAAGAALLPMTVAIMLLMVGVTERLMRRVGAKALIVIGLLVLAAGLALLTGVDPDGSFLVDVLPGSLVAAVGMSLAYIPAMITAMSGARPEEAGLASGMVNTTYQVGSALGLGAMTAVAAAATGPSMSPSALTDGFSAAFAGAALIAMAAAALAAVTVRRPAAVAQQLEKAAV